MVSNATIESGATRGIHATAWYVLDVGSVRTASATKVVAELLNAGA